VNKIAISAHLNIHFLYTDSMLSGKLKIAIAGLKESKEIYDEHCIYVGKEKQELYLDKEKKAQKQRGEALRIYEVSEIDG
jgi:hypothetical protein